MFRPDKKKLVIEALKKAGREDLIGYGPKCLVHPYGDDRAMPHGKSGGGKKPSAAPRGGQSPKSSGTDKPKNFKRKSSWAKPKPTEKSKKR